MDISIQKEFTLQFEIFYVFNSVSKYFQNCNEIEDPMHFILLLILKNLVTYNRISGLKGKDGDSVLRDSSVPRGEDDRSDVLIKRASDEP